MPSRRCSPMKLLVFSARTPDCGLTWKRHARRTGAGEVKSGAIITTIWRSDPKVSGFIECWRSEKSRKVMALAGTVRDAHWRQFAGAGAASRWADRDLLTVVFAEGQGSCLPSDPPCQISLSPPKNLSLTTNFILCKVFDRDWKSVRAMVAF